MKRLAVMAHYDRNGAVAPHVRRQVEALAAAYDDLVVVSTAELTGESRDWLAARCELLERDNVGYDFFSYRAGLAARDLAAYDEVTICNDSYVFVSDYRRILDEMEERTADFWGFTETDRVAHHVQSFFVTFRRSVLASAAFRSFWSDMEPISDRWQVIRRYEVGMSGHLYAAGFTSAAYFVEDDADRRLARERVAWWAVHRQRHARFRRFRELRRLAAQPWNPSAALADRAFIDARLPYVKIDTLRYDPYGLDAAHLLTLGEQRVPAAFAGVRDFLTETAQDYPPRQAEVLRPTPRWLRPLAGRVRYGADL